MKEFLQPVYQNLKGKNYFEKGRKDMKMKKWLAVLMTIAMCAVPVMGTIPADVSAPLSAYAEGTAVPSDVPAWSGKSDHSWYDESESEFHLTTPEEFAGLMELGSQGFTMAGKTIYLETDVNLGENKLPVMKNFAGTLDGNNHTIYGMKTTFVEVLNEGGTIQNLSIVFDEKGTVSSIESTDTYEYSVSSRVPEYKWVWDATHGAYKQVETYVIKTEKKSVNFYSGGILCCKNSGTIQKCHVLGAVNTTIMTICYLGTICGENSGTISGCSSKAFVNLKNFTSSNSRSYYIGGICGKNQKNISSCINQGEIHTDDSDLKGSIYYGGICGYNLSVVSTCQNKGTADAFPYSGGIVGSGGTISESENYETIIGTNYAGGIAGSCDWVFNSANYGKITGTGNAGGIAGYVSNAVSKCKNEGTVLGDYAGGILGNASSYAKLSSVYNTGEISGWENTGGICGNAGSGSIENAYNVGKVTNTSGKSGAISADIKDANCINCYYSNTSVAVGAGTMKSEKNMQTEEFAKTLGEDFVYVSGRFPILTWEAKETRFDKDTLYLTEVNQQEKLTLITLAIGDVTWLSSDTNVATVDNSGNVTAVGDGTAQIYAICGEEKAVCSVTVQQVQLEKSELSLEEGKTENISVVSKTTGKAITDMNFTYTSSDESIATVNESGLVTAAAEGSCEITVKSEYVNLTCQVTVSKETIVEIIPTLDKSTLTIEKGSTSPLHIKNYTGNVTWISSDTKVATVSGTGTSAVITALEEGKTIIYAMLDNGKNLTCQVTATKKTENTTFEPVLSLDVTSLILKKGTSSSIGISNFWMVANQDVTWVSSDTKVATVDGYSGVWWLANVTAIGEGTATIYAMLPSGENLTCQVTVTEDGTILMGDVDGDGSVKVADLMLLQKWIHADPNAKLANWQNADFNGDGKVNVIDLALMKQMLTKNK